MDLDSIRAIANAVLYEGHMLYPYRPSALKNRSQGWSFGTLLPPAYVLANFGESELMQGEILLDGTADSVVNVEARFLQLVNPFETRERAVEVKLPMREIGRGVTQSFEFSDAAKPARLCGALEIGVDQLDAFFKLRIRLLNRSENGLCADRDQALVHGLIAAHALVTIESGRCISLLDPSGELSALVADCKQVGVFPVMVGDEVRQNAMLLSPIILYDYPRIATQSKGDFFDSTEMDEMLSLRVLTLSDAEKNEIRAAGGRVSELLQRTEALSNSEFSRMHGIMQPVLEDER